MNRAASKVAREIADVRERWLAGGQAPDPSDLGRWLLLLTPPRKKRVVRSPRAAKRRATVKELDALCREIVFERDGGMCRDCKLKPAVDWSHVYSRRYKWLRWDLDNSFASCKGCHLDWHARPSENGVWWEDEIGTERYRALVLRAAKPRKTDPELVRQYLIQERGKL